MYSWQESLKPYANFYIIPIFFLFSFHYFDLLYLHSFFDLFYLISFRYMCLCKQAFWIYFILFSGTNISTGEEVAIKLECIKTRHPQLHIESKFYKMMQGGGKIKYFCIYQLNVYSVLRVVSVFLFIQLIQYFFLHQYNRLLYKYLIFIHL